MSNTPNDNKPLPLFEELQESSDYKAILGKLSTEERAIAEKSIRDLLENFERSVLEPLRKLTPK